MSIKQFFALIGFGFVLVWAAVGLGTAVLCLIGAAVFAALAGIVEGDVDLAEVQDRVRQGRQQVSSAVSASAAPPPPPPPRPAPVRARRVR